MNIFRIFSLLFIQTQKTSSSEECEAATCCFFFFTSIQFLLPKFELAFSTKTQVIHFLRLSIETLRLPFLHKQTQVTFFNLNQLYKNFINAPL